MAERLEGYVPPAPGAYSMGSVRTYQPGDPDAPRAQMTKHQQMRHDHGLAKLAPFRGRSSFSAQEKIQLREALKIWGDLLPADEWKQLADAVRETFSVRQAQPAPEPAPDPAAVASALRRLADRIDGGDAEAARAIVRAADS